MTWVDGQLVPRALARIAIDDFSVRYGGTCFEMMLARNGRVFRLQRHLDRLAWGLRLMRAPMPAAEEITRAVE
ncbi:MAG: hypothetical protein FJZ92_03785 [Chloroflexi bacterium]|nr:hypothetical protein [Chloroflexota bacterium]